MINEFLLDAYVEKARAYPQHPEREMKIVSEGFRKGGKFREVIYTWPNGKKVNGKPALASQTFHERIG